MVVKTFYMNALFIHKKNPYQACDKLHVSEGKPIIEHFHETIKFY